jgi:hypothetical protein
MVMMTMFACIGVSFGLRSEQGVSHCLELAVYAGNETRVA